MTDTLTAIAVEFWCAREGLFTLWRNSKKGGLLIHVSWISHKTQINTIKLAAWSCYWPYSWWLVAYPAHLLSNTLVATLMGLLLKFQVCRVPVAIMTDVDIFINVCCESHIHLASYPFHHQDQDRHSPAQSYAPPPRPSASSSESRPPRTMSASTTSRVHPI